jgi:hypothetical protein
VAYATIAPIDITPTVVLRIAIAAEYICSIFLFSAFGIFWLGLEPVKSYANLCTNISLVEIQNVMLLNSHHITPD